MKLYGIALWDSDGFQDGVEYYFDKKERDDRAKTVSSYGKEVFELTLTKRTIYQLNYFAMSKDKRKIRDLQVEVKSLKTKLKAKVELIFHEQIN